MSLDRGTRIYAAVLAIICLSLLLIWMLNLDLRLEEIDDMIGRDSKIASYPYPFRALEIEGTTAVLSSPRSNAMPAVRFLGLIKPGLINLDEQDPELLAAQKELAEIQSRVRKVVLMRNDIDRISWRLDKEWYAEKGILLQ
ncbi:MAG: hypothetical protein B6D72_13200 [gamma proteobacterium symbiont of Ctena orbiculata]|nr:hypothetical protein [Candidatus Thiodiazotropha taylori]PUB82167.1 MAG: hypothetical protein DBP00_18075 [gamma proteobacterium symbiont of Ctena orbiculata]MBT2998539.1 hypothetical protein [Candidatus Thiodiazotropha taylori]MBT3002713.1 hypothetical protein [Candidatus Thiodiazotropha taylori]MBT3028854.1 hypothetical protein [Candidatus Thiodiazotropha taylori]